MESDQNERVPTEIDDEHCIKWERVDSTFTYREYVVLGDCPSEAMKVNDNDPKWTRPKVATTATKSDKDQPGPDQSSLGEDPELSSSSIERPCVDCAKEDEAPPSDDKKIETTTSFEDWVASLLAESQTAEISDVIPSGEREPDTVDTTVSLYLLD